MATALACSNRSVRFPEMKGRELGKSKDLLSERDLVFEGRLGSKRPSTSHLSAIFLRSLKAMISAMSRLLRNELARALNAFPAQKSCAVTRNYKVNGSRSTSESHVFRPITQLFRSRIR